MGNTIILRYKIQANLYPIRGYTVNKTRIIHLRLRLYQVTLRILYKLLSASSIKQVYITSLLQAVLYGGCILKFSLDLVQFDLPQLCNSLVYVRQSSEIIMSTIIYGNISRCLSLKDECYQLLPISELTQLWYWSIHCTQLQTLVEEVEQLMQPMIFRQLIKQILWTEVCEHRHLLRKDGICVCSK